MSETDEVMHVSQTTEVTHASKTDFKMKDVSKKRKVMKIIQMLQTVVKIQIVVKRNLPSLLNALVQSMSFMPKTHYAGSAS